MPAQILPTPPMRRSGVADLARGLSTGLQTMAGFALRYKQMAIQTALAQQEGVKLELQSKLIKNKIQESQYNQSLLRLDVEKGEATQEGSIVRTKAEDVAATGQAELKGAQSKALLGQVDENAANQLAMGNAALVAILEENKAKMDLNLRTKNKAYETDLRSAMVMWVTGNPQQKAFSEAMTGALADEFGLDSSAATALKLMRSPGLQDIQLEKSYSSTDELLADVMGKTLQKINADPALYPDITNVDRANVEVFLGSPSAGKLLSQTMTKKSLALTPGGIEQTQEEVPTKRSAEIWTSLVRVAGAKRAKGIKKKLPAPFKEGDKAFNEKTGKWMVYRKGEWVKK